MSTDTARDTIFAHPLRISISYLNNHISHWHHVRPRESTLQPQGPLRAVRRYQEYKLIKLGSLPQSSSTDKQRKQARMSKQKKQSSRRYFSPNELGSIHRALSRFQPELFHTRIKIQANTVSLCLGNPAKPHRYSQDIRTEFHTETERTLESPTISFSHRCCQQSGTNCRDDEAGHGEYGECGERDGFGDESHGP